MGVNWDSPSIHHLIAEALREDSARQDITTRALIPASWRLEAAIRAKERGVLAGLPLAARFFEALDKRCRVQLKTKDGQKVGPGQTLFLIKGPARSILSAERPALNTLQHLSGIATFTHQQVLKLRGTRAKLFDTRKTLPGWRALQKYAVTCGGGQNHRISLGDAILVKENHLKILRAASFLARHPRGRHRGSINLESSNVDGFPLTVRGNDTLRKNANRIQIEIQSPHDLKEALTLKPSRVLLDNLSVPRLKAMIRTLRRELPETEIEISGGVKPENLRQLARLGVERISMGKLTHSAPAFDCSMDILRVHTS